MLVRHKGLLRDCDAGTGTACFEAPSLWEVAMLQPAWACNYSLHTVVPTPHDTACQTNEKVNRAVIYDVFSREESIKIFMGHKEETFKFCDTVARGQGRLSKVVTLFDMKNLPVNHKL